MTHIVYVNDYDEEMHSYLEGAGFIEWDGYVSVFNQGQFPSLCQPGGKAVHFTAGQLSAAKITFVDESTATFFILKFDKKIWSMEHR